MTATVGSLSWAARTRGRLRARDRVRLFGQAATLLPLLPGELASRFGRASSLPDEGAVGTVEMSPTMTSATAVCQRASGAATWLYPHSARAFEFGRLYARRHVIEHDAEILWVAAMFHDLGLADGRVSDPDTPCFAVRGAEWASRFAERHGWSDIRRRRLAAAICGHINVAVSPDRRPEGHLLNVGSALDVAGLRYSSIAPAAIDTVLAAHPRRDFSCEIWRVWTEESDRNPGCRAGFLRATGLGLLITHSPWEKVARG